MTDMGWVWKYLNRDESKARAEEYAVFREADLQGYIKRKEMAKFPVVMMFETSAYCNIQCLICPRKSITRNLHGEMPFSLFKSALDQSQWTYPNSFDLDPCNHSRHSSVLPCQITLHYSGEPLLNPELPKMIEYAKNKAIPLVRLNSNGMLLNESVSRKLIKSRLDNITIALECTPEVHAKTRCGSNYARVCHNVEGLMKIKKELGMDKPGVWIQMLTSQWTTERDIEYGLKRWENIVDFVQVASIHTIAGQVPNYGGVIKMTDCGDVYVLLGVLWNGDVTVCCADHNGQLVLGNAYTTSIHDLWSSQKHKRLVEAHKHNTRSLMPQLCQNCILPLNPLEKWVTKGIRFARRKLA